MSLAGIKRISIIGLGLIGGSLGLALKHSGLVGAEIVGYVRSRESSSNALARRIVDRTEMDMRLTVRGSQMVLIAVPPLAVEEVMQEIGGDLVPGSLVMDNTSTKTEVMQWADKHLPQTVNFVGGHPMAGKETSGLEVAEAGLFRDRTFCLVPSPRCSKASKDLAFELVKAVGAKPLLLTAAEHDFLVAGISHLPLVVATALVNATTQNPFWMGMSHLAASGYRDTTRLASQHPAMNRDICVTNRANILDWLDELQAKLQELRRLMASGSPEEIERVFQEAKKARDSWFEKYDRRSPA